MKKVLPFLKKLKKNNNTPWMHAHKDEYLQAKGEFEFFVQEVITRIGQWDSRLPMLEPKSCIFRLNRDVRFSNDKRPYKENFGAFMSYGGKKSDLPGYYIHISPNEIFAAGGVWMPENDQLLKIRRYISENGESLQKILKNPSFKKTFGSLSSEQALKRPPKGFDIDNPWIEYIKLKSFIVSVNLKTSDVARSDFGKIVDKNFKVMKPLNDFLMLQ